ncbi:MAG: hypothetical protein V3U54_11845 [Thermodesulfobacteriota bacterium]
MIKTKTLFILGAGASAPFQYPTGDGLRDDILNKRHDKEIVNALNHYRDPDFEGELSLREIKKFKEKFTGAGVYSIDSFLEHRTEFMDIGKISIARMLISYEIDNNLRATKNNWYMYLFDRMKGSFGQLDQNNISFITFNYDRSLEYFLFEAVKDRFGRESTECAKMMKNLFPIVHLYGQLDPLPWQEKDGKKYSSTDNLLERLCAAPENIKLISDERDIGKSEEFQKAYKLIKWADRIFFLGFSFDETNLKRLNISLMKSKTITGTALNLEKTKYDWVKNHFDTVISTGINLYKIDALSLLQDCLTIE